VTSTSQPLSGVRVIEVAVEVSDVGAGLAVALPGMLCRDLGASVVRVDVGERSTLDRGVDFDRVWHHGKQRMRVDGPEVAPTILELAADADLVVLAGPEPRLEGAGVTAAALARNNPRLVMARIRPGFDAAGPVPDFEILTHARTGLMGQLRGRRGGPTFINVPLGAVGAGLAATATALALLYERESTGIGGWIETSVYDGLMAILPMIIGQVEHPSPTIELLWHRLGPAASLMFRCADDRYLQLWFGAKGAYEAFLEQIGDEPSEAGYNADTMSGAMVDRSGRWASVFATRDRQAWLDELAGRDFRVEPVLRPGEILDDPHVREIGLSTEIDDPDLGRLRVLGPVIRVTCPVGSDGRSAPTTGADPVPRRLLHDIRVLDMSAYLAGPVAAQVLAELGADVIKVEPTTGDAHRAMEPLFAAGHRGKRALALDLKSPEAHDLLGRLFASSDVVHHNSRVGLAERLGYDEATVREANPDVVYSFSSGFGADGPRALLPANDYLMQALTGMEAAIGGCAGEPTFNSWGSIDVTGGWVSACGILAGLLSRRRFGGGGRSVDTTLLGAGALLRSGSFIAAGRVVEGPMVDAGQTGLGATYRVYCGADDQWFAIAVPDARAWEGVRSVVGAATYDRLPDTPPALRGSGADPQPEELVLQEEFARRDASVWVAALRAARVPVEPVFGADRIGFVARLLDDPINRQLGRVASYEFGERGRLDQPGFPVRIGPLPRPAAPMFLPRLGEHTTAILNEVGVDADARAVLRERGVVAGD